MERWRWGLAAGVLVVLGGAIWLGVAAGGEDPVVTTTSTSSSTSNTTTTSTTTTSTTTTTVPPTTSTTVGPEARVEEVRLILEDLWFRWFDAIYRNDEEAVRDVVATERLLEDFTAAGQNNSYPRAPRPEDIDVRDLEILFDEPHCLVTHAALDMSRWRDVTAEVVDVMWPHHGGWRFAGAWVHPRDLWMQDCEGVRQELP